MGIFRTVNQRMELRMGKTKATLIMPMVGGLLIGLIGVAFPLTFGDGSLQLRYVVGQGEEFGSAAEFKQRERLTQQNGDFYHAILPYLRFRLSIYYR